MIIAKGLKNGKKISVKYENETFLFDGRQNKILLIQLEAELKRLPIVFGTYCANNPYEILNIIGVLREHFFDDIDVEIETDEEITEKWESGVVY